MHIDNNSISSTPVNFNLNINHLNLAVIIYTTFFNIKKSYILPIECICPFRRNVFGKKRLFLWSKFHPRRGHEGPKGELIYSSTLSLISALDGVGGQRHASAALPLGQTRYPLCRRLAGPQGRSARVRKMIIFLNSLKTLSVMEAVDAYS
jgi:hypothetical protein